MHMLLIVTISTRTSYATTSYCIYKNFLNIIEASALSLGFQAKSTRIDGPPTHIWYCCCRTTDSWSPPFCSSQQGGGAQEGEDKVFKTSQLLRSLAEMMRIHMKWWMIPAYQGLHSSKFCVQFAKMTQLIFCWIIVALQETYGPRSLIHLELHGRLQDH